MDRLAGGSVELKSKGRPACTTDDRDEHRRQPVHKEKRLICGDKQV